jgi:hypothetical protein
VAAFNVTELAEINQIDFVGPMEVEIEKEK